MSVEIAKTTLKMALKSLDPILEYVRNLPPDLDKKYVALYVDAIDAANGQLMINFLAIANSRVLAGQREKPNV